MAAIPEVTAEQMHQAVLNQVIVLLPLAQIAAVVHLSPSKSVNLNKVTMYRELELMDTVGEGKAAKEVSFDPPQFGPFVYFEGQEEPEQLTAEENEVFREVWERHAYWTAQLHAGLDILVPQPQQPAIEQGAE